MGTWIKETEQAIYLMDGNRWVSRITKYPAAANPGQQVADIAILESWLMQSDPPVNITFSHAERSPEPEPAIELSPMPPTTTDAVNDDGMFLIKYFRGLALSAYPTASETWAIGYGHTSAAGAPDVNAETTMTESDAEQVLRQELLPSEREVRTLVADDTYSDQFSAMVSFAFNVGLTAYRDSALLRKHNAGDFMGAAEEFLRWVTVNGRPQPDLIRRRKAERALYLSQDYSPYLYSRGQWHRDRPLS